MCLLTCLRVARGVAAAFLLYLWIGKRLSARPTRHPAFHCPFAVMSTRRSFPNRVFITVAIVALTLLVMYLFVVLSRVLLVVFAGVLLAVALGGGADLLRRRTPLGRRSALALVILILVALPVLLSSIVGPGLGSQVNELIVQLPEAFETAQDRLAEQAWIQRLIVDTREVRDFLPPLERVMGGVTSAFSQTLGVLANVLVILFIGIYGAAAPKTYVNGVLHLTPARHQERAREVLNALAHALRWWLIGRLTMMSIVGVLTTIGLWIVGVPSPLALGLLAALLSFIPYLGPILSFFPAALAALLVSLTKVLYVALVFGIVQTLESYVITPLVQQKAVSLVPIVLITAQIAMGVLAGATGVLLAAPLVIVVIVLLQMLYVEDVLGNSVHILGQ